MLLNLFLDVEGGKWRRETEGEVAYKGGGEAEGQAESEGVENSNRGYVRSVANSSCSRGHGTGFTVTVPPTVVCSTHCGV